VAGGLAGTLAAVPLNSAPRNVLGANDRIRFGIIGAGDRGLELVNQLRVCPNTDVAAFADIYTKRLEKASSVFPGAKIFRDARRIFEDPSIDAVMIATPPHLHASQFCAALEAGKHVYQEKVLALSVADAKRMRQAWREDGARHVVEIGHQACSHGQMADVRQFLQEPSRLGRVTALAMRNFRNTPPSKPQWARPQLLTADVNERNVDWKAFLGQNEDRPFEAQRLIHWRYFWDTSGGGVSENMSQQLAFWVRALDLQIPESAFMSGGVYLWNDGRETPDTMQVSFEMPERMLVSWASGFGNSHPGIGEDLLGSAGTIARSNDVRYVPQKMATIGKGAPHSEMLGRTASVPHVHVQNFADAIRFNREPNCGFETGYRVAIACRMAVESYQRERVVRWDAAAEEIV
jgi:predicted dehydrogenase